ncbi:serine/threonine-protein kinase pkn5-like [Eriocheir sinensis]|uniref:serine/threonine-protein kinase pkn5-like n=1 Tax=Eriocheir sinensis TaxID=95602 RepID=UPI0021C6E62A|nr:serine/threonine-protein kinase pkn5-like [Eriocheir sinensis]
MITSEGEVEVVVKQLLPSRGLSLKLGLEELLHEAILLARVSGVAGVPRLHGMVLDPPSLVTSFDGPATLGAVVRQWPRRVSGRMLVQAVAQVCGAVAGLHQKGVAHNDIKSNNVVVRLGSEGSITACLIDLGNSSKVGSAIFPRGRLRWEDYPYLAPELVAGEPSSEASDVFSLGHMMATFSKCFKANSKVSEVLGGLGARATDRCPAQRPALREMRASIAGVLEHASRDTKSGSTDDFH